MVHLATHSNGRRVAAWDISTILGIPANYLGKILHALAREGILESSRGKHGGFRLAVPPEQISLLQIVSLFDSLGEKPRCLLGRMECSSEHPCAAHGRWKGVADQVTAFFNETTVSDLLTAERTRG